MMRWQLHTPKPTILTLVFLIVPASEPPPAKAQSSPGIGVAQPKAYDSPSGIYALFIDPADRYGRGGAQYRLSKNGVEVWSGEKPFTLRDVVVSDEGLAAGFAYRTGPKQDEPEGKSRPVEGPQNPPQYLHIVILGADGNEVLNDVTERVHPGYLHAPLYPYLEQLLIDPANDRLIARVNEVSAKGGARWWVHRLSTGESLHRFDPKARLENTENLRYVLSAHLIAETPLILVHWYVKGPDYKVKDDGGRFTLFDAAFEPIWSIDAPNDYAELDLYKRSYSGRGPRDYFDDHPAVLLNDEPRQFHIRLFAENKEVAFLVRPTGDSSYEIIETQRTDLTAEEEVEPQPQQPKHAPLAYLGELAIGNLPAEESPFQALLDFTFDENRNLYFIKRGQRQSEAMLCAYVSGKVVSERPFDLGRIEWTQTGRLHDGRFFVWRSKKRVDDNGYEHSSAWVELSSGKETPSGLEISGWVDGLSRFQDGGFVVLDSVAQSSTSVNRLTRYDVDGSVRWQFGGSHGQGTKLGLGPQDVVVTTRDQIAVLEMGSIRLFNGDGELLKQIDLTGAFGSTEFGGRPGYLHEIVADNDGGFLIADSNNPPVVLRYNADGSVRSRWSPRHPDGKTFDLRPKIRVAPDGRLWTGDGKRIMRLTDEGVVDLVLGPKPDPSRLDKIAALNVDGQGNIYAVAHGAGVVHVFDRNGAFTRTIEPNPADMAGTVTESFVAVNDNGEIYLQKPHTKNFRPPDEYLRFSPTGEQLETITFEPSISVGEFLSPGWAFQPETGYRCGIVGGDVRLVIVDPPNKLIREVHRRPNRRWFGNRTNLAMAPDGSMAVLDHDLFGDKRAYDVDLFSADGDPLQTIPLPPPNERYTTIAYDGRRVVVAGGSDVAIIDTANDRIVQRSLTESEVTIGRWSAFILPDSDELLLFDDRASELHRFELPEFSE